MYPTISKNIAAVTRNKMVLRTLNLSDIFLRSSLLYAFILIIFLFNFIFLIFFLFRTFQPFYERVLKHLFTYSALYADGFGLLFYRYIYIGTYIHILDGSFFLLPI